MASNDVAIGIVEPELPESTSATTTPRVNQVDAAPANLTTAGAGGFAEKLSNILFLLHLVALVVLVIFLSVRGFTAEKTAGFRPVHLYVPLLASAIASAAVAVLWLLLFLHRPSRAIKAAIWLGPSLTCGTAVLLLADGTSTSLAFAVPGLVAALVQSLYGCWITPRLDHARRVLHQSVAAVRPSAALAKCISSALLVGLVYYSFWTLGVGGIAIAEHRSRFAPLYVVLLLLSLWWTMQLIKHVVYVALARLAYMKLACGVEAEALGAFTAAIKDLFSAASLSAAVVPLVVTLRGAARAITLVAGDEDEFLFSCASCYMGVADGLAASANRWGLVHVGALGKGLRRASEETWGLFMKQGMGRLIDMDITSSVCFMCGMSGGGVSGLVAGTWVLAAGHGHVVEASLYAFLIGYFMTRIALGWPQAGLGAYHVAYAENPLNSQLGGCIPDRLQELQSPKYSSFLTFHQVCDVHAVYM